MPPTVHALFGWCRAALLLAALPLCAARQAPTSQGVPSLPLSLPKFDYVHPDRPLPAARPDEAVLLTVVGPARTLKLTLAQLRALPAVRYQTFHPQLRRAGVYEGVPLRDLAARVGLLGRDVQVSATNGFAYTIRARDYQEAPIMLAYAEGGRAISVQNKGPVTVVLPPAPARLRGREYAGAWVWYAERIAAAP